MKVSLRSIYIIPTTIPYYTTTSNFLIFIINMKNYLLVASSFAVVCIVLLLLLPSHHSCYASVSSAKDIEIDPSSGEQQQQEKYHGQEGEDDDDDTASSYTLSTTSLSSLFVTQKPRDAIEGIKSAISNTIRGTFYGITAFIASPIGGLKFGTTGIIGGLITGTLLGVTMPFIGVVTGGYQILRGVIATPVAIVDGFFHCKVYDETRREWMEYRLDEDIEEIGRLMKEDEQNKGKNGSASNSGSTSSSSSSSSRRRVKSTKYYDLLGIPSDASPSDIRSAYRKKARVVHPDKNPDDPDAVEKFRLLSAAYQTLSDPAKRNKYDSSGVGVDPEKPEGAGGDVMLDPIVFFAVLFGSEQVEHYIGELSMATTFDALIKLGSTGPSNTSFESMEDIKSALGWNEVALKRRKRETDIAVHLRSRISDYVEGYLALNAFKESAYEEAVNIANGSSYGASFLLAIGPALVAEADAFLGYRSSVLGSWRGPVSNAKRNLLFLRRKYAVGRSVLRAISHSFKALYESAEIVPNDDNVSSRHNNRQQQQYDTTTDNRRKGSGDSSKSDGSRKKPDRVVFNDKELLKDNLSNTIPTVLDLAWAINYVDISNTLYGACGKLFYDADVSSWEERLRRAEAVHILGSQFYLVGLEVTGGNTTSTGNVDDIKAQANAAFMESLKKGNDEM